MSKGKKRLVPVRRFKEFENSAAWEQRKLGEVSPLRGGFAFKSAEFCESGVPVVRISNIQSKGIVGGKFIYYPEQKNDTNYLLPDKSAVIAMSGATTGKVAILMNLKSLKVYQNQRVGYFTRKKGVNYDFVSVLIRSSMFLKQLNSVLVAGAQPNVSSKDVDGFVFLIPSDIREQQKIGKLFQQLDSLIALHQRKLDKLKRVKSAYLTEMFPAEGEREPKRRFPGFTGAWEQRRLGDLVTFYSGLTYSPKDVRDSGTLVLRSSNVKNGEIVNADNVYVLDSVVNSNNVENGDVIVVVRNGSRSLIGKHALVKRNMKRTVIGAFMTGIRSENPNFINALLDTRQFNSEINKNLGATINQITTGSFKKMKFMVAYNTDEQEKIGAFFKQLDSLIVLHQRKLDKLKKLKAAYLNEMFV